MHPPKCKGLPPSLSKVGNSAQSLAGSGACALVIATAATADRSDQLVRDMM